MPFFNSPVLERRKSKYRWYIKSSRSDRLGADAFSKLNDIDIRNKPETVNVAKGIYNIHTLQA